MHDVSLIRQHITLHYISIYRIVFCFVILCYIVLNYGTIYHTWGCQADISEAPCSKNGM